MAQETGGIYSLTRIPAFYALFQDMLAGTTARRRLVSEFIQPREGERVIELGCGAGSILRYLGNVSYLGVDENPAQIARARRLNGQLGTFAVGDFKKAAEQHAGSFDLVLFIGFMHHLDDARADEVLCLAHDLLVPGGRLVAIDPAFTPDQHWMARWLAKMDSGRAVRSPEAYRSLAKQRFLHVEVRVIHDLLRVPYTHNIMVASR